MNKLLMKRDPEKYMLFIMLKDSGNSSGRSATFRNIYFHKSHTFKVIDFKFSAVLGNSISFYFMKTNCTFITQQKK